MKGTAIRLKIHFNFVFISRSRNVRLQFLRPGLVRKEVGATDATDDRHDYN